MKRIASIVFSIAIFGCHSNNKATLSTADSASSNQQSAVAETSSGDAASTIKVIITGGANAGTYTATSNETTCSIGLAGDKSFGNQYSIDAKGDKEFSSLQLVITNMDEAKSGTGNFMVTVGFGKILNPTSYTIDGTNQANKKGSGTAKLSESGKEKDVTIDGTTADGIHITATIVCKSVMTSNGVQ